MIYEHGGLFTETPEKFQKSFEIHEKIGHRIRITDRQNPNNSQIYQFNAKNE